MYRIEMHLDAEWSCVAMVTKDLLDETLAQHIASVGAERVRAVEVVDNSVEDPESVLRERQDRDYEACLLQDQEQERLKAMEERRNARKKKQDEEERQKNRPGLDELRLRRLQFYDFQNRRLTRSAAKRLNYK